jgi:hypothetical protein
MTDEDLSLALRPATHYSVAHDTRVPEAPKKRRLGKGIYLSATPRGEIVEIHKGPTRRSLWTVIHNHSVHNMEDTLNDCLWEIEHRLDAEFAWEDAGSPEDDLPEHMRDVVM